MTDTPRGPTRDVADAPRGLCDGLPVAVYRRGLDGQLHYANAALLDLLGYPRGEPVGGINLEEAYFDERDRRRWRADMEAAGAVRDLSARLRRQDGTVVWVQDTGRAVRDDVGRTRYYEGVLTDVTDRRHLEEWRGRLAAVLEATIDFVATFDAGARLLWVNRAGRRMLGVPDREDLLGAPAARLHPTWAQEVVSREGFPAAAVRGAWSGETALQHRDGHEIPVSQVIVAHPSTDGDVEFYSTVARDITERKRAENGVRRHAVLLELLQSVTAQAAELSRLEEALPVAVREIAHRTGWPVGHAYLRAPGEGAVLLPTALWHMTDARFAPLRRATDEARGAVGRDLPGRAAASGQVEWVADVRADGDCPRTAATPIVAGYAVPVCLDGEAVAVLEFYHDRQVERDQGLVRVVVQIGEQLARVAARQHAEEQVREADAGGIAVGAESRTDPSAPPSSRRTVLVVEDEGAVRAVVGKVLRSHGYHVLEAADGESAWRTLMKEPRVDLLLTDMVMPGISGRELAERARARRAELKVLFMSGYGEDLVLQQEVAQVGDGVLTKPFSVSGLARRVGEVLGAESERMPA